MYAHAHGYPHIYIFRSMTQASMYVKVDDTKAGASSEACVDVVNEEMNEPTRAGEFDFIEPPSHSTSADAVATLPMTLWGQRAQCTPGC